MNTYEIKDVIDIHKIFSIFRAHPPLGWWFRGQANSHWKLIPKAGRQEYNLPNNRDLGRFKEWKTKARAYIKLSTLDWENLAIAQHYGMATRLLDWTYNPLIATYFAVCENFEDDGMVYCYEPELFVSEQTSLDSEARGYGYIPEAIDRRVVVQQSIFSLHSPANAEIEIKDHFIMNNLKNLNSILIPQKIKREILKHLNDYGINQSTIFPDLTGLSHHLNWLTKEMVIRKKLKDDS